MPDLLVAVTVTRAELGLGDLTDAAGFAELASWDPGGVSKRRTTAKSPTLTGGTQTSSVADMRTGVLQLRIFGASKSLLDAQIQTWLTAFEQTSYTLTVALNGIDTTWDCDDAEYNLAGDGVDKYRLTAIPMRQVYEFRVPMQPYPTVGVL